MAKYTLRLYVTGTGFRSEKAINNIRSICKNELSNEYSLEVVDVLENPQLAEDEKIMATPTLVKMLPPPLKRLIGDLSDKEKLLIGLDLKNSSTN